MSLAHVVAVVTAVVTIVTAGSAVFLWRRRTLVGARSLAVANGAVAVWSLFYTAELLTNDLGLAVLWSDLKYAGVLLLPPAFLLFALQYTGRGHMLNGWLFAFLAKHPIIMTVLLASPATHDLIRERAGAYHLGNGILHVPAGDLYRLHFGYATAILAIGTAVILRTLISTSRRYLRQSLVLTAAVTVPWIASLVLNLPGRSTAVDLAPITFAIVEVACLWGVFNFQLFNLAPVARSTVVDTLDDAVIVVDPHARIVDLNSAAEALLRVDRRAACGAPLSDHLPDHPDLLCGDEWPLRKEISLARHDHVIDYEVMISTVGGRSATVPGHVLVLRDVTDRRRAQRRMEHLVHYDQLTDLPNRTLLADRLDQALALARRTGEQVGVLFVDLDGFKEINDSLGHDVGDLILRETAHRMLDCLRESDTAARLGGDEFMLVVPGISGEEGAAAVALKVLGAIAGPFTAAGRRVHLSASVGIAVAPPNPLDRPTLTRLADSAMYEAKARGKHRYAFADVPGYGEDRDEGTTRDGAAGEERRRPDLTVVRASDPPVPVVVEGPGASRRSPS